MSLACTRNLFCVLKRTLQLRKWRTWSLNHHAHDAVHTNTLRLIHETRAELISVESRSFWCKLSNSWKFLHFQNVSWYERNVYLLPTKRKWCVKRSVFFLATLDALFFLFFSQVVNCKMQRSSRSPFITQLLIENGWDKSLDQTVSPSPIFVQIRLKSDYI